MHVHPGIPKCMCDSYALNNYLRDGRVQRPFDQRFIEVQPKLANSNCTKHLVDTFLNVDPLPVDTLHECGCPLIYVWVEQSCIFKVFIYLKFGRSTITQYLNDSSSVRYNFERNKIHITMIVRRISSQSVTHQCDLMVQLAQYVQAGER